jgi:hypothetical protein
MQRDSSSKLSGAVAPEDENAQEIYENLMNAV